MWKMVKVWKYGPHLFNFSHIHLQSIRYKSTTSLHQFRSPWCPNFSEAKSLSAFEARLKAAFTWTSGRTASIWKSVKLGYFNSLWNEVCVFVCGKICAYFLCFTGFVRLKLYMDVYCNWFCLLNSFGIAWSFPAFLYLNLRSRLGLKFNLFRAFSSCAASCRSMPCGMLERL